MKTHTGLLRLAMAASALTLLLAGCGKPAETAAAARAAPAAARTALQSSTDWILMSSSLPRFGGSSRIPEGALQAPMTRGCCRRKPSTRNCRGTV